MSSVSVRLGSFVFLLLALFLNDLVVVHAQPAAVTLQAQNVTQTSATLVGMVITSGQNTEWMFEYSEGSIENKIGQCPQPHGILPGNTPQAPMSCQVTNLKPSTTYWFTLFVKWVGQDTWYRGDWLQFTTLSGGGSGAPQTDWAVSNPIISPASPKVGDEIVFSITIKVLSSTGEYPQTASVAMSIDHQEATFRSMTYAGPTGSPMTISWKSTDLQWSPTVGQHVLEAGVYAPPPNDPDQSNNGVEISFTVSGDASTGFDFAMIISPPTLTVKPGGTANFKILLTYSDPSYSGTVINIQLAGLGAGMDWQTTMAGDLSITTLSSTPLGSYPLVLTGSANGVTHQATATLIVTSEQSTAQSTGSTQPSTTIQTVTQVETTTQAMTETTPVETLTQTVAQSSTRGAATFAIGDSDLIIVGLIAAVVVLVGVIALRRRRHAPYTPPSRPAAVQSTVATAGFCVNCGAALKPEVKFCGSCGERIE